MWANIRRGSWLKTLGAACIGYLAMVWLSMASDVLMIKFLSTSNFLSAMAKYFPHQGEIRTGEVYYDAQNLVFNLLILAAAFPSMVLAVTWRRVCAPGLRLRSE
jgi:hypothetical protein